VNYRHVYFRINTPSYYPKNRYGVGFSTQEDAQMFQNKTTELFLNEGWEIKVKRNNYGCNTITKTKQELYLHPQSISGVVAEEDISIIENILSKSTWFNLEKTDIYESVFDITDEAYLKILEDKRNFIEQDILEKYKTKRSNLYITDSYSPLLSVLKKYKIKRLSKYIGVVCSDDIDVEFMRRIFEDLIKRGEIITNRVKSGIGYRTITNKEKKFKIA
jgi:hypothetical protein